VLDAALIRMSKPGSLDIEKLQLCELLLCAAENSSFDMKESGRLENLKTALRTIRDSELRHHALQTVARYERGARTCNPT
jgi:hypothetical protein